MKIIASIVACLLIMTAPAMASVWYVDSLNGNNANDGLSVVTAFADMVTADGTTLPGDTVYVRAGKGYGPVIFHNGGSSANGGTYVTWTAYQGDTMPVIHATATGENQAVCFKTGYTIFNGFDVSGNQGRSTFAQAWTNASQDSEGGQSAAGFNEWGVTECSDDFPTFGTTPSAVNGASKTVTFSSLPSGTIVGDVVIDTTNPTRIAAGTTIASIASNVITLTVTHTATTGDSIAIYHKRGHIKVTNNKVHDWPGNGIQLNSGDYFTISNNLVFNNGFWSPSGNSGISLRPVDEDATAGTKIVISGNIVYGNQNFVGCDCFDSGHTGQATPIHATAVNAGAKTVTVNTAFNGNPPTTPFNQWQVFDITTPAHSPAGTVVTALSGTTMTLNNTNTIAVSDVLIVKAITDGEGIILDDLQYTQGEGLPVYGGRQLVQNNLAFGNGSAGFLTLTTSHTDVVGNTFYLNQQTAAEQFYGDPRDEGALDSNWLNNAIETCSGCQLFFDHASGTTSYGNNLNHGGGGFQGQTTLPGSNNVNNIAAGWVAPSITPPTNIGGPPFAQYFTNFQLSPGSPAIDAGSATVQPRSLDIAGSAGLTGPAYDIGAYESHCSPFVSSGIAYSPRSNASWCGNIP